MPEWLTFLLAVLVGGALGTGLVLAGVPHLLRRLTLEQVSPRPKPGAPEPAHPAPRVLPRQLDAVLANLGNEAPATAPPAEAHAREPRSEAEETEPAVEAVPEAEEAEPVVETLPEAEETEPAVEALPEAEEAEPVVETLPEAEEAEPVVEALPEAEETEPAVEALPEAEEAVEALPAVREKRRHPRIRTDDPILITPFGGSETMGEICDVSLGGVRFRAVGVPLRAGDMLRVTFNLAGASLSAFARVLRTRQLDDITLEVGAEFARLDPWALRHFESALYAAAADADDEGD